MFHCWTSELFLLFIEPSLDQGVFYRKQINWSSLLQFLEVYGGGAIMSQASRSLILSFNKPLQSNPPSCRAKRWVMFRSALGGCRDCAAVKYPLVAQLRADLDKGAYVFRLAQVAERRDAENRHVRGV